MSTTILSIESSCDDTSAAVLRDGVLLSNVIASQKVHERYGGVVPELASRSHQQNIIPVVDDALKQAGVSVDDIQAIGFTRGPGLLGSLLVGSSFAKAFALAKTVRSSKSITYMVTFWQISSSHPKQSEKNRQNFRFSVFWFREDIHK